MEDKVLSHIDQEGKANMVDVSPKPPMIRTARAAGKIHLLDSTLQLLKENQIRKGDVLTLAEIAGIQAMKQTSSLIPLCHPLQITKAEIRCTIESDGVLVESMAKCIGQTGIEMEALTGVSIALLTIYDMCKAVDKEMHIETIHLLEKTKVTTP